MAGRYTLNGSAPTLNDLQWGSYTQASDGKPAVVVTNLDGSNVGGAQVSSANTPSISSGSTALAANSSRHGWQIQNVGTNPLFVLLGSGCTTSVFHFVLKGGTTSSDGTGGSYAQMVGVVYQGIVTIAGTSPSYVTLEV